MDCISKMQDDQAPYLRQLFEMVRIGRNTRKALFLHCDVICHQKELCEVKNKCVDVGKFISYICKEKKCYYSSKKSSNIIELDKLFEALEYFTPFHLRITKLKLQKIIDIFHVMTIPPAVKNINRVIIIIEKDDRNDKVLRRCKHCPDCMKDETLKDLKKKISENFKKVIASLKEKLIHGLQKKKKNHIYNEQPCGFFTMNDVIAPFPEVETFMLPDYSMAGDWEPQAKSNLKTNEQSLKRDYLAEPIDSAEPQNTYFCHQKEDRISTLLPDSEVNRRNRNDRSNLPSRSQESDFIPYNRSSVTEKNCNKYKEKSNQINQEGLSLDIKVEDRDSLVDNKRTHQKIPSESNYKNGEKTMHQPQIKETILQQNTSERLLDSTIDFSSDSNISITPIFKIINRGGKRDMLIKLKNIPDNVDIVKIKSKLSRLHLHSRDSKQRCKYFLKKKLGTESLKIDSFYDHRVKNYGLEKNMTSPNKICWTAQPNIMLSTEKKI